jgi:hypothetical protein
MASIHPVVPIRSSFVSGCKAAHAGSFDTHILFTLIKKCVAPIHMLVVVNVCSTVYFLKMGMYGLSSRRCS